MSIGLSVNTIELAAAGSNQTLSSEYPEIDSLSNNDILANVGTQGSL
jgi:hypothetical protein